MKKIFILCMVGLLFNTASLFSQAPLGFKYQAVARNAGGNVLQNQDVSFRISLLQGSSTGSTVYIEEHTATTNAFGLVNLEIGTGTNVTGIIDSIQWANGPYFIKIEMDATGGSTFTEMGVTQLLSVPYALYAASGNPGPQGIQGLPGADGLNGLDGVSITSTLVQNDSLFITLSNGNTLNAGYVKGAQGIQGVPGIDGSDGISITNTYIQNDSLFIILSTNQTINAGYVRGPQGIQGIQGLQGPAGTGLNNRGNWISGTIYNPSDYVFDRSTNDSLVNSMWICQASAAFTSTTQPYLDNTNWVEFEAPSGQDGVSIAWLGTLSSAPSLPSLNQAYYNSTDKKSYIWNGTSWNIMTQDGAQGPQGIQGIQGVQGLQGISGQNGISISWLGSFASAPSIPLINQAYYNTTDKTSYIWDGEIWQIIAQDGLQGNAGVDGTNGTNGISVSWLGTYTSDPSNPLLNQAYYNSTDKKSYIYNGTSWQMMTQDGIQGLQGLPGTNGTNGTNGINGISVSWLGTYASDPSNPSLNQAYYNSTDKKSYIFDGTQWQMMAQDGINGTNGTNGTNGIDGTNGISVSWLGTYPSEPASPSLNQAYYNSTDKKSYIYNGATWQMMAQDGINGTNGTNGSNGTNGTNGTNGNTIISGTVDPSTQGVNGDYYINTASNNLFGPKTGGTWGTGTSLIGPQGTAGTNGTNGYSILNGTVNPTTQGVNGDFYINTATNTIFGPKTAGSWGTGTLLVGPQGVQGIQGPAGTGLNNRGNWLSGSTYDPNDYVFDRSSSNPAVNSMWISQWSSSFVSTTQPYQDGPHWIEFQAPAGPQGVAGANGTDGKTVLNGTVDPTTQGTDGDFYINTTANTIFGPKTSGIWGTGTSLIGPQGTAGTNGTNGYSVLNGTVDPTTQGVNGDFYINTATNTLFGPKTAGLWGSGTSLVGPAGSYTAGTGIQISSGIITNTAPDQVVSMTSGTGISITGTYPNFTVNSSQTLAQTLANGNSAGSYNINMNSKSITNANVLGLGYNNANYLDMYYGNIRDYAGSHGANGQVLTVHGTSPNTYVTWDTPSSYTPGTGLSLAGSTLNSVWTASGNNIYNNNTGKVGVGTSNPKGKLTVNGWGDVAASGCNYYTIAEFAAGTASNSAVLFNTGATGSASIRGFGIAPLSQDFTISRFNSDGTGCPTNDMIILSNGNVGIGNIGPGYKLDVTGDIRSSGELISTNTNQARFINGNYGLIHRNDGANYYMLLTNSGDQYGSWNLLRPFVINNVNGNVGIGDNTLFIQNGGNVGIKTTSPNYPLQINSSGDSPFILLNTTSTTNRRARLQFGQNGTSSWELATDALMDNTDNLYFFDRLTSTYGPVIKNNGNVGIGTTNPGAKLEVGGQVKITGGSPGSGKVLTSDASGLASWQTPSGGTLTGSGTATRIAFWSGTSSLSSNANLYWDNTNSRLGVGTAVPTSKMQICAESTLPANAPIFEIKDQNQHTIMVVYKDSIHFYVKDPGLPKGQNKGCFAVSGKSSTKSNSGNLFYINTDNTLAGQDAGKKLSSGIGYTGYDNTFIGYQAGYNDTTGFDNVFVGSSCGSGNISGSLNVFLGKEAGLNNTTGTANVFIGQSAGSQNTTGLYNTIIGTFANPNNNSSGNTIIGFMANDQNSNTTGNNTMLGCDAGYNNNGSGNVFLGFQAGINESGSNKLYIANSATNPPLIYGDFSTKHVGIGTTSPLYMLHVTDALAGNDDPAIFGEHNITDYYGVGVKGVGRYRGVWGSTSSASGSWVTGVFGEATGSGTGNRVGVYGSASGGATAYAGYFSGNVNVTGTLSKGGGSFKIDHPLDPENKYLYHSFVESPDMKNIYDGIVILDNSGKATVQLPDWFEAVNNEFRYQLTAIGCSAPNLYISQEVSVNTFEISGGSPGMKVSWMVTGIRHDPFAVKNRIPVEVDKPADEKGYYLYPDVYGQPDSKSIDKMKLNQNK